MDGATIREGRVEVCSDGRWGTVCGEGWTERDAGHVCSTIGYPREGEHKHNDILVHSLTGTH